jgi:pimeloyl-ACP methyl ester carboxylesterase
MIPLCDRENFGTLLSLGCGDPLSDASRATLDRDIAGRKPYADLFQPGPLAAQCDAWDVKPAAALASGPFGGGVPVLILRGAFDPFSTTPGQITVASAGQTNVQIVEVPNASYDVLGPFECVRAIRNAWVDSPGAPPADSSCLAKIPAIDLGP